ncbi:phage terminase large subunit [Candidatus Enterovibrio escicola]|uniref:phage terminase large subunit n=1 Tax=Candidatus Enterovibrio escicola TaxID=1927127 RepID=UPI0012380C9E|nr:phage terminase large subunit [Candidatus Enterovibrio escacola]
MLYRNPQYRIMVVAATKRRAELFIMFVRRLLIEFPLLSHLKPKHSQLDYLGMFDVAQALADQSPSVKAVDILGQLTSSRADFIISDDIEIPNNSATQAARDKISELMKELDAVLKPLSDAHIIYLGTKTEMTVYNSIAERSCKVRI